MLRYATARERLVVLCTAASFAVSAAACRGRALGYARAAGAERTTDAPGGAQTQQERPPRTFGASPAGFLGRAEARILDRLTQGRLARVEKGGGGRSLGFKLYFEDGTKGYYKPAQSFSGTIWNAEVVAYYVDRALGMGRVPPVVARRFPWARLRAAAASDRRVDEIEVAEDGAVSGALSWWLPAPLERAKTPPGWENWVRVERFSPYGVTPFQRASSFAAALRDRKQRMLHDAPGVEYYEDTPKADRPDRAAELSDMLVLDFLLLNIDRWGGNNANVLTLGAGGPLIFLDNAAGLSPGPPRRGLMDSRLEPCQRFRKSTLVALRALSVDDLERRMARDPLAPLLSRSGFEDLEVRRKAVLAHVEGLRRRFGDKVFFEKDGSKQR